MGRLIYVVTLVGLALLLGLGGQAVSVSGGPLAQATATPTATATLTPTPTATAVAALNWNRVDHPDDVRCYWATFNGQPVGGCVVVSP